MLFFYRPLEQVLDEKDIRIEDIEALKYQDLRTTYQH
jgi:cellobiose-specific phosphotransferase system component IIB